MSRKYFGIDLGTENIGYAVTDEDYNIIKCNGRNAIGASTYSSDSIGAKTAVGRRMFRVARRRLMRRKYRITLLQELFAEAMSQVDSNFFVKLNENDLNIEHKSIKTKYSLFNDATYRDNEYYKQYPTIYHLRKDIIDNGTNDIRKLYLAIHHIIKYRGHFLITEDMDTQSSSYCASNAVIIELNEILQQRRDEVEEQSDINVIEPLQANVDAELHELYLNKNRRRIEKKKECCKILSATSKPQIAMVDAIFGGNVIVSTMFGVGAYAKGSVETFSFEKGYDNIEATLMSELTSTDYHIIKLLKQLHDNRVLVGILKGSDSISTAMVAKYEKHQADLAELKAVIKEFAPEHYSAVFAVPVDSNGKNDDSIKNYTMYIGGGRPNGKEKYCNGRRGATCSQEDLGSYIKSILNKIDNLEAKERIDKILRDIEDHEFMPRVVSKNNSMLPYQLNMLELSAILSKIEGSAEFSFLKSSENGITVSDKIKMLLLFRVPYYVGPLKYYHEGEEKSKNAWAVRNAGMTGRITPWNFDTIINRAASNEAFINRMSSQCSYLKGKTALPKNSLIYSKFMALTELNKLKVNGELMDKATKRAIWNALYIGGNGKPTINKIVALYKSRGVTDIKIEGYDESLKGDMSVYHCFKRIIGGKVDTMPQLVERLIYLMTVHNESKVLAKSIESEFGDVLSASEVKMLKGLRYSGWGRLSCEFLTGANGGIKLLDQSDGEYKSIIDILDETNHNIMDITSSKQYDYDDRIKQYNLDNGVTVSDKITYDDVNAMYCSPSVKRSVWQTFKLIKTLVKETGGRPDKIFIEVTRTPKDETKGKTVSRKEQIAAIYNSAIAAKNGIYLQQLKECKAELEAADNKRLNSEKIYLYFMQMGRCAYSKQRIEIGKDFSGLELYDVDHIIPRAKKKDDSLDNKVLVSKILNDKKSDIYPVSDEYRNAASDLWKYLKSVNLMSEDKYTRLMRVTPLSVDELTTFINRQLVETSQMALLVRDLLERWLNSGKAKTEIVLNKAANISDFRRTYNLTKSRDVNDFHHAVDAYLNIVVGNVLSDKFNHGYDYDNHEASANFKTVFRHNVYSAREKRNIWQNNSKYCTIDKVREQLDTVDYSISKKTVTGKGELFAATIIKADKFTGKSGGKTKKFAMQESKLDANGKELNAKSDTYNYGFKNTSGTAYFVVVDSVIKKKIQRTIEAISVYEDTRIKAGKTTLEQVVEEKSLIQPTLANIAGMKSPIIKVGALLHFNGTYMRVAGMTGGRITGHNANQLIVSSVYNTYIKELSVAYEKMVKAISLAPVKKEERDSKLAVEFTVLEEDKRRRAAIKDQTAKIVFLTSQDNIDLYDFFVIKLNKKPYSALPGRKNLIEFITKARNSFCAIPTYKQVEVLLKIVNAFKCRSSSGVDTSDLYYVENGKEIKGRPGMGVITRSNIISASTVLVHQSASGLRQREVQLWDSEQ